MEETEKHMFVKVSYIFDVRGKQVRVGPMKKMENLGPGRLCWRELHNVSDLCVDDRQYNVVLILLLLSVHMFK